jgi:hypothetical protein
MTELSPAAQATYDAFNRVGLYNEPTFETDRKALAAALCAALNQVVPEHREHHPATLDERHRKVSAFSVRDQFLAIAAELEGQ